MRMRNRPLSDRGYVLGSKCQCGLVIILTVFVSAKINANAQAEADRVYTLPGQSNVSFAQYSGYITVNESHGRALFYWFFQAQDQHTTKALILWLNGGPGCSSIGYGASIEMGPFRVKKDGTGLVLNEFSWNKEANMLFVESPVGVGFSYTNTSDDLLNIDDKFTAEDSYEFLVRWFQRFPQFKSHDFYIGGESYAGHYVPQLAELVYDRSSNKDDSKYPINLRGFIVGNPETDYYYDYKGMMDYAWSHAITSDRTYNLINKLCNFKEYNWTDECNSAVNTIYEEYRNIDIYNLYAPTCPETTSSGTMVSNSPKDKVSRRTMMGRLGLGGYDPCFETYTNEYFNRKDVQHALHANITSIPFSWAVCNNSLFSAYKDTVFSVLPIYRKLIKAGLRIWVYSGDIDGRVPVLGTRYCMDALKLAVEEEWRPWYHAKQVGGWVISYKGLTFITVRGAGHLVPLNKPSNALYLFRSYLRNHPLRNRR